MTTLIEIETAAGALPPEQQEELIRFLANRMRRSKMQPARMVRRGNDSLLEAPPSAPPMTPENIKRILEDWP